VHITANQKKRGVNVVPGKDIKQAKRVRVIGPIVESQSDLLRTTLPPAESPPKPLASWGKRLISGSGCADNSASNGQSKHAWIVNVSPSDLSLIQSVLTSSSIAREWHSGYSQ
jgi:hypothetical protein